MIWELQTWISGGVNYAKIVMKDDAGNPLFAKAIPYDARTNSEFIAATKIVMQAEYAAAQTESAPVETQAV